MFYSTDARHEGFWRGGIARNAVFFHSFVALQARKVSSEKRSGVEDRLPKMSTKFAPRCGARAISAKKKHQAACSEHFLKLSFAKFAPGCGARAIWKSKPLESGMLGALLEVGNQNRWKTDGLGAFLEVQSAFCVAGAMVLTRCKRGL